MSQSLYEHVFDKWDEQVVKLPMCLVDLLTENITPYMSKGTLRVESEDYTIAQFMNNEGTKRFIVKIYDDEEFGETIP